MKGKTFGWPFERFGNHGNILINISLKFVAKGPINNKLSFVQVMGWCQQALTRYVCLVEFMYTQLFKLELGNLVSVCSFVYHVYMWHIDELAQDYSIPIAIALEMLQSCTKPSIYTVYVYLCLYHLFSTGIFLLYQYFQDRRHCGSSNSIFCITY